jgi:hypothetical protein
MPATNSGEPGPLDGTWVPHQQLIENGLFPSGRLTGVRIRASDSFTAAAMQMIVAGDNVLANDVAPGKPRLRVVAPDREAVGRRHRSAFPALLVASAHVLQSQAAG